MRRLNPSFALAILAAAGLTGCATSSLDMAPESPDRPWQPQTDATGAIVPGPASASASASASAASTASANPAP
ncbi:MAG TPA: TolC family protein, partial [Paraburkholderia sp.]